MNTIKAWAYDVAVRAAKTFAQTLAGMLAASAVDILHVDWRADLAVAAGAAVACVLQNVQSFPGRQSVALGVVVNNAVHDVTPSVDATGHPRLDFADGKAMFWDAAAQSFKLSVPNASTPEPTPPAAPADSGVISGPSGPLAPGSP